MKTLKSKEFNRAIMKNLNPLILNMKKLVIVSFCMLLSSTGCTQKLVNENYPFRLNSTRCGTELVFSVGTDSIPVHLYITLGLKGKIDNAKLRFSNGTIYSITDTIYPVCLIQVEDTIFESYISIRGFDRYTNYLKIESKVKMANASTRYIYVNGKLFNVSFGNYENSKQKTIYYDYQIKQYVQCISYFSAGIDLDPKKHKRELHQDSARCFTAFGNLKSRSLRVDDVDSIYYYDRKGSLTHMRWSTIEPAFIDTSIPGLPLLVAYYFTKTYNRYGDVVFVHMYDADNDVFITQYLRRNGQPSRICQRWRDKEECNWYKRNGSLKRTKSWVTRRSIIPIAL